MSLRLWRLSIERNRAGKRKLMVGADRCMTLQDDSLRECAIERVEAADEIFSTPDFFEDVDDAWLLADLPDEVLVGDSVMLDHYHKRRC